jgi:hypothetical protein
MALVVDFGEIFLPKNLEESKKRRNFATANTK